MKNVINHSKRNKVRIFLLIIICIFLGTCIFGLTKRLRADYPVPDKNQDYGFLPSPKLLLKYSFGFNNILADLLWIRAVTNRYDWDDELDELNPGKENDKEDDKSESQFCQIHHKYCPHHHHNGNPIFPVYWKPVYPVERFYNLTKLSISLDPQNTFPYEIAAILLLGNQMHYKSNEILFKGFVTQPDNWFYPYFMATNYYFMKRFKKAAEYMALASDKSGCPPAAKSLTATFHAEVQDYRIALAILEDYYNSISQNDNELKNLVEKRIEKIKRKIEDKS